VLSPIAALLEETVRNAAIRPAPSHRHADADNNGAGASPASQRGKTYALTNCGAVAPPSIELTNSPLKIAPPFRTLHLRYPVETLGEALAEASKPAIDNAGIPARSRPDQPTCCRI